MVHKTYKMFTLAQMYILLDEAYDITCCGVISGWEFMPLTTGFVYMMVWRYHDSSSYTFVGQNSILVTSKYGAFDSTL